PTSPTNQPNQNHISQSIKREAALSSAQPTYQSTDAFATCVQTKQRSPSKSVNRSDSAPALYLSASAALPCDFLRIATLPPPRNLHLVENLCM
ncbi:MAG TPA: hypothetical protein VH250_07505, partial [Granulicella sp.]|nr:hypothetical protein [Granulicella sp.]